MLNGISGGQNENKYQSVDRLFIITTLPYKAGAQSEHVGIPKLYAREVR